MAAWWGPSPHADTTSEPTWPDAYRLLAVSRAVRSRRPRPTMARIHFRCPLPNRFPSSCAQIQRPCPKISTSYKNICDAISILLGSTPTRTRRLPACRPRTARWCTAAASSSRRAAAPPLPPMRRSSSSRRPSPSRCSCKGRPAIRAMSATTYVRAPRLTVSVLIRRPVHGVTEAGHEMRLERSTREGRAGKIKG
uniref:Uncharacterized protein n=1 Tax=Aegilops tauschii subsp. strangulata TaxID=200361 RepID=A0A453IIR6_AEGTS